MKTFKKVVNRIAILVIILSMMITSQVSYSSAGPVDFNDPVFNFDKILFVKHEFIHSNDHGSGGHMCDQFFGFNAITGGGLYILNNPFSGTKSITDVLANSTVANGRFQGQHLPTGSYLAPDLSYDGNQILFTFTEGNKNVGRTWNETTTYHIFKVNVDGTGLTMLTDGPYNDLDPCWLPDGRIAFISERRGGYGRCHGRTVPTFTLYTMNSDGSDIRCISYHETNEWQPSVDNNGMIVWSRWDYVDRGHTQFHMAWTTTPDGTDARPVCGNYRQDFSSPLMHLGTRAIPNSDKYVATASCHHQQQYGGLIIIDPDIEDDDANGPYTKLVPDCNYPEAGGNNEFTDLKYGSPYPLSEKFFLCVNDPNANTDGLYKNYSLYAIDSTGNKSLLYNDPSLSCFDPIPLRSRSKPNIITTSTSMATPTDGIVTLFNVYDTLIPFPGSPTINQLRILQVYPKTTPYADGPPISYAGQKNTKGVLGTVPIETDGSAQFYMPAGKAVLFQALDSTDGTAAQNMKSDTFIVPGTARLTCQGCHEPRHTAPNTADNVPTAVTRTPSTITAETMQGAKPICFPRLIQPILDSKCISCHTGGARIDLRKGSGSGWSTSYNSLNSYVFRFNQVANSTEGSGHPRSKPGEIGSKASSLYTYLKNATHSSMLTANEKRAFIIWMDSGTAPFYGDYLNTAAQEAGEQVDPILD